MGFSLFFTPTNALREPFLGVSDASGNNSSQKIEIQENFTTIQEGQEMGTNPGDLLANPGGLASLLMECSSEWCIHDGSYTLISAGQIWPGNCVRLEPTLFWSNWLGKGSNWLRKGSNWLGKGSNWSWNWVNLTPFPSQFDPEEGLAPGRTQFPGQIWPSRNKSVLDMGGKKERPSLGLNPIISTGRYL